MEPDSNESGSEERWYITTPHWAHLRLQSGRLHLKSVSVEQKKNQSFETKVEHLLMSSVAEFLAQLVLILLKVSFSPHWVSF